LEKLSLRKASMAMMSGPLAGRVLYPSLAAAYQMPRLLLPELNPSSTLSSSAELSALIVTPCKKLGVQGMEIARRLVILRRKKKGGGLLLVSSYF
jgi:hypothetical protein